MHKARYWLLLKIAQAPRAFTYGAGLVTACLLIFATLAGTVWFDKSHIAQKHAAAMRLFEDLVSESTKLLRYLHIHDDIGCSPQDLAHLNTHLLETRYIREIGIMDSDMALICSTALGPVAEPIKGDFPVHISRHGLELLNNVPLSMANKKLHAVIVRHPPFNVAISPFVTADIYADADVAWLRTAKGLVLLESRLDTRALASMQKHALQQENTDFRMAGLAYELTTVNAGSDLVLQTRRGTGAIMGDAGLVLPVLLAGSVLIAALVVGSLTPYVARLTHLNKRIGFLCKEAHLALVYQPIFDLQTMRPVGCEVLARLKEGRKIWRPGEMIPAIQSAGLEYEFDCAVTRKALHELAAHLPAQPGRFGVALNYFPESVGPGKLLPVLSPALAATGRHDLEICVEITEYSLSNEIISEVQALKEKGFLVAVDDFGTGYSNLKTVTGVAPDVLKIDRSFVYELEEASVRASLIPEIIHIAEAVNAHTVAEGIETLEQARLLAKAGVRFGQGYALARPMEMAAFIAFLATFK